MPLGNCVSETPANYRDVGIFVNLILGRRLLAENRLLRGGAIKHLANLDSIGGPATVLCLKNGPNRARPDIRMLHYPRPDTAECYQTAEREVKKWLRAIVRSLVESSVVLPLYIHCHSGRDRTGVVVAALLSILNIPAEAVTAEYMLSDGADEAKISTALAGLEDIESYFPARHISAVRTLLL